MKHSKLFLRIFLITIIAIGLILGKTIQTKAQKRADIIQYLVNRFDSQNIPVTEINVLQDDPLHLEFIIQSASDGEKGPPEDPINFHLVEREAILARQQGFYISRITRIFLNNNGVQISKSETDLKPPEFTHIDLTPSSIDDASVQQMITNKINGYGIDTATIDISSVNGFQTLTAHRIVSSLDEANKSASAFAGTLRSLIDEMNSQGAQIA